MGYPEEIFLSSVNPELLCSICHDVLSKNAECPHCEESFCRDCIVQYLRAHHGRSCPNCRHGLTEDALQTSRKLRNILDTLRVKCPFWTHGCEVTLQLQELDDHVSNCDSNPEKQADGDPQSDAPSETADFRQWLADFRRELTAELDEVKNQNRALQAMNKELQERNSELKTMVAEVQATKSSEEGAYSNCSAAYPVEWAQEAGDLFSGRQWNGQEACAVCSQFGCAHDYRPSRRELRREVKLQKKLEKLGTNRLP